MPSDNDDRLVPSSTNLLQARIAELEQQLQQCQRELHQATAEACHPLSELQISSILQSITDAFFCLDSQWRFTYLNPQVKPVLRRSPEDLLGKHIWEEFPEAIGSNFYHRYHYAMQHQTSAVFEEYYPLFGIWVEVRVYPFEGGLTVYLHDISGRKQAELALQQLNQDLEKRVWERTQALEQSQTALRQSEEWFHTIFDLAPVGIILVDPNTDCFVQTNGIFQAMLGYSEAELANLPIADITHLDDLGMGSPQRQQLSRGEVVRYQIEKRYITKSGEIVWVSITATPLCDRHTQQLYALGMVEDITDRRQADEKLRQSEAFLREAQQVAHLGSWELDLSCSRVTWSEETFRIFRLDPTQPEPTYEELLQRYIHPDDRHTLREAISQAIEQAKSYAIDLRVMRADGTVGTIYAKGQITLNPQGQVIRLFGVAMDITERKQVEANLNTVCTQLEHYSHNLEQSNQKLQSTLEELEVVQQQLQYQNLDLEQERQRYADLFDFAPDGYLVTDPIGIIQEANHAIAAKLRIALKHLMGKPLATYIQKEERSQFRAKLNLLHASRYTKTWEMTFQPRQGQAFIAEVKVSWIENAVQPVALRWLIRDITDRKQAEEALRQQAEREQLLRAIMQRVRQSLDLEEMLTVAVSEVRQRFEAERTLIYRLVSGSFGLIVKESASPESLASHPLSWMMVYLDPESAFDWEQSQHLLKPLPEAVATELGLSQEAPSTLSAPILQQVEDGSTQIWGLLMVQRNHLARPWRNSEAEVLQQIAAQLAISIQQADLYQRVQLELRERRQIEAQLRSSLQEKEVLLKEVHHRVKNNLQIISALLSFQAEAIQDPRLLAALKDSENRLRAMALIHETIYQAEDLGHLNFSSYIQRLAENILVANTHQNNSIQLVYQLENVFLNLETAIPCGLLLNELITNAIKHAFPNRRSGEIRLTLQSVTSPDSPVSPQSTPRYRLCIADNGIGLPPTLDLKNLKSLGLRIADDLAQQLRGTLELNCSQGTQFQLIFSELKYRKRF